METSKNNSVNFHQHGNTLNFNLHQLSGQQKYLSIIVTQISKYPYFHLTNEESFNPSMHEKKKKKSNF